MVQDTAGASRSSRRARLPISCSALVSSSSPQAAANMPSSSASRRSAERRKGRKALDTDRLAHGRAMRNPTARRT